MKFIIRHDIKGRLRVHLMQESMTYRQADTRAYYLENVAGVTSAKVYDRTADAVICYTSSKKDFIKAIKSYQFPSKFHLLYCDVCMGKSYSKTAQHQIPVPFQWLYLILESPVHK